MLPIHYKLTVPPLVWAPPKGQQRCWPVNTSESSCLGASRLHSTVEQLRPQLSLLGSESALRQVWGYTAWVSTWGNGWEPVEVWGNPLLQGFYDGKGDPQNPTLLQEEEMPMFSHSWTPSYHQLSSTRIPTEGCVTPLAGTFLWERQAPH